MNGEQAVGTIRMGKRRTKWAARCGDSCGGGRRTCGRAYARVEGGEHERERERECEAWVGAVDGSVKRAMV